MKELEGLNLQLRGHYKEHGNVVVGVVKETNKFASKNQYLLFCDKCFYWQGNDGEWRVIWYEKIKGVQVYPDYMIIREDNNIRWSLPNSIMWKSKMGLNNFRLFLLIMAKSFGSCRYQFAPEEVKKLKKIGKSNLADIFKLE